MSAPTSRPPVPRPAVRKTAPPPAIEIPQAYAEAPPVIRDRLPTLELADDDLVLEAPVAARRSTPPPPPPSRSTVVPKLEGVVVPKIAPMPVPKIAAVAEAPESSVHLKPRLPSMLDPSEALFDGMYELELRRHHLAGRASLRDRARARARRKIRDRSRARPLDARAPGHRRPR